MRNVNLNDVKMTPSSSPLWNPINFHLSWCFLNGTQWDFLSLLRRFPFLYSSVFCAWFRLGLMYWLRGRLILMQKPFPFRCTGKPFRFLNCHFTKTYVLLTPTFIIRNKLCWQGWDHFERRKCLMDLNAGLENQRHRQGFEVDLK